MKPTFPMRAMIFEPVVRFGIPIDDWPLVFGATFLITVPFWFADTKIGGFPIWYLVAMGAFTGAAGFFAWARIGKPRRFAHHFFRFLVSPKVFGRPNKIHPRTWIENR
jgi:membrane protein DedA with SNARE-associated domain